MSEMVTISKEELENLQERARKLAMEKSNLQLITHMMEKLSAVPGLENTIETMLRVVLETIGGTNLIIYYVIDTDIYYADVFGKKMKLDSIDDDLVKKVFETHQFIEDEHDFSDTKMMTPEFTKAWTWVFPLLVGPDMIGVFKMENMHVGMQEFQLQLPTFFNYAALILKNEILGYTKLKQAYDQLEQEVIVRKQAEEELRHAKDSAEAANRAKSAFLANMSHELRTPLNAILGFAQMLQQDSTLTPIQYDNLKIINNSGKHLLDLINDVLEMSKIEAGRTTLTETNFDLYDMLDTLKSMFGLRAQGKDVEIYFERDAAIPRYIQTDERKLRQVLINLLGNAIKFTDKGQVMVRVKYRQGSRGAEEQGSAAPPHPLPPAPLLHFEVEDTGVGIAPEEMEVVFEAFGQTRNGRQAQEGTGLGLTISRHFVQLMGGNINVTSAVGQGSLFKFDIRATEVDPATIKLHQLARRVVGLAPGQRVYRILVAEDRAESRALLVKLLEAVGLEVRAAANGQEAIDIWQTWEPDLIWMDMRMPIMNGLEATKQIKASLKGQATAVIALTASVFEEDRVHVLSAGCDDFVYKPYRQPEIFDKMAQHLGLRFIYEEEEKAQLTTERRQELTPDDMAGLPAQWVTDFHQATKVGDPDEMLHLIKQIETEYPRIGETLSDLTQNFHFGVIIAAIASSKKM